MNHAVHVHAARARRRRLAQVGLAVAVAAALVFGMAPAAAVAAPAPAEAVTQERPAERADLASSPAVADRADTGALQNAMVTGRLVDGSGRQLSGLSYVVSIWDASDDPIERAGTTGTNGEIVLDVAVRADLEYFGVGISVAGFVLQSEFYDQRIVDGIVSLGDIAAEPGGTLQGSLNVPVGSGYPQSVAIWPTDADSPVAYAYPSVVDADTWTWSTTVLPGTYEVQLSQGYGSLREEWWRDARERTASNTVPVAVGSSTTLDGSLELRPNTISGRMLDEQGAPVRGSVTASGSQGGSAYGYTDEDGYYVVAGIAPGEARVQFSPDYGVRQYWQNAADWQQATPLRFETDTDYTGIDAVIDRGYEATGSVQLSGVDADHAQIVLTRDMESRYAPIGADGSFVVRGLADGVYAVEISTNQGSFATGRTLAIAGAPADLGVVALELGRLAGAVPTSNNGWSTIDVYAAGSSERVASVSTSTGQYSSLLPVGEYRLALNLGGERIYYGGAANLATTTPIAVSAGATTIADFSTAAGAVHGRLIDEAGAPITNATVELYTANAQGSAIRSVATDTSGTYRFDGLRENNYALRVADGGDDYRLVRWIGGSGSASEATVYSVDGDQHVDAGTLTLPIGGAVRGAIDLPGTRNLSIYIGDRTLWLSGEDDFVLRGVPAGTHAVRVVDSEGTEIGLPRTVTVAAGETTVFDLRYGSNVPSIAGVVTDGTSGLPVQYARVTISALDGSWYGYSTTGEEGRFTAYGLEPGAYRLQISADGYRSSTLPEEEGGIVVVTGQTVSIQAPLTRGVTVTGRVIDGRNGAPVADAEVRSQGGEWAYARTRSDGTYTIVVPSAGAVELWVDEFRRYVPTSRMIELPAAGLTGVDFSLTEGGVVSGTVVAANNRVPLSNIDVGLQTDGSWPSYRSGSDMDGNFRTNAVEEGVYDLTAENSRGLYVRTTVEDIAVGTEGVQDVEVPMTLGGRIVGTLRDAAGEPVPYATVGLARPSDASPLGRLARAFGADNGAKLLDVETTTNEDGAYELPAVAGGDYALYSYTSQDGTTWFDGKRTLAEADRIGVTVGGTSTIAVTARELQDGEQPRLPAETISDEFAITVQPRPLTIQEGGWAQFSAFASGSPSPGVQWQTRAAGEDWTDSPWADDNSFSPQFAGAGVIEVRAVFTQGERTLTSDAVKLTVEALPVAPGQASAPTIGAVTGTSAAFSWAPVADAQQYEVRLLAAAGQQLRSVTSLGTSFDFTGLSGETVYAVSVTAVNAAGAGPESLRTSLTTAKLAVPSAPRNVTAAATTTNSLRFAWTAPATDGDAPVTGYRATLSKAGEPVATQDVTTRFATFGSLIADTEYSVTVVATSAAGASAASDSLSARTAAVPVLLPPSALAAPAVSATGQRLTATFSAAGTGATSIEVELVRGGAIIDMQTLQATRTSLSWEGLEPSTEYTVYVTAVNSAGRSAVASGSAVTGAIASPFRDVPVSYQFFTEISWMASEGISTGYALPGGASEYRPWSPVTRDAMAAFLYRFADSPEYVAPEVSPFRDVSTTSPFYKEISWLASTGISTGWDVAGGKEFRPFSPITRDAMAAFLYRYAEVSFDEPARSPFTDVTATSSSFYREITWLASEGISTGWDVQGGKAFKPFDNITRDAMAAFLYRADSAID